MTLLHFIHHTFNNVDQDHWKVMIATESSFEESALLFSGTYVDLWRFATQHLELEVDDFGTLSISDDHITIWVHKIDVE